jgi:glycosyl transferase family 11
LILDCTRRLAGDRSFCLDRYSIRAQFRFDGPSKVRGRYFRLPGRAGTFIADAIHRVFPRTVEIDGQRFRVIEDRKLFTYDTRFDTLSGSIYLKGGWQCFRYFENAADIIRAELRPAAEPSAANREWLDRIRQTNSVGVHVRRGDYLSAEYLERIGVCLPAYYTNAVKSIRARVDNPTFFIFSDDLAWCRDNLAIEGMILVDANSADDPVNELRLMAACRHHIIANSSFSWWAAWLASHSEQVVIAPYPWMSGEPPLVDFLPDHWTKMPRS